MAMEVTSNIKVSYSEVPKSMTKTEVKIPEVNSADETVSASVIGETKIVRTQNGQKDGDNASQEDEKSNSRRIQSAISSANNKMKHTKTKCEFSYHESTKRVSIKVIDKETEEVIREIPPEETLQMIEKMWELAGILVDEKR